MDVYVLARVLHVLAVIHWIGGVAMVTLVILPQMLALPPADRIATFERLEGRFGGQAKLSTLVAGLSGLWMLWLTDGWALFLEPGRIPVQGEGRERLAEAAAARLMQAAGLDLGE